MAFPGGRISGDISPSNTGQDLGDATHKWDLYGQDVHVDGTLDLNGATLSGNFTGNVAGNVVGNVTGSVTGNLTGTASLAGIRTNNSSNTDICGTIAIAASTTGTYTFTGTYATAPVVTVTPTGNPTAVGVWWVTVTTTTITVHVATSGTIGFNYTCIART